MTPSSAESASGCSKKPRKKLTMVVGRKVKKKMAMISETTRMHPSRKGMNLSPRAFRSFCSKGEASSSSSSRPAFSAAFIRLL